MALGINTASAANGDIKPICKYDARAGRFARVDRTQTAQGWETNAVDITQGFKACFDFENIETGWMCFMAGVAPDMHMGKIGSNPGPRPSENHKHGFRIALKLSKECGGDVREFASAAKVVVNAMDALHDAYLAGVKSNAGKLPIVACKSTQPIKSGSGSTTSTNYAPVFMIEGWAPRPADLVNTPTQKTNGRATPPDTGSTHVEAPGDFG